MVPKVFIGSSVEGLDIARAIQVNLDHAAEVELWSQGAFGVSEVTLTSLIEAAENCDFAVLVLTSDDLLVSRGQNHPIARDNLIFELGLFIGALGSERTAFVIDRNDPPNLPTDLAGITPVDYALHANGNLTASVGAASTRILGQIESVGTKPPRTDAAYGTESDRHYLNFVTHWRLSESPVEGYWRGVNTGVRHFVAERPIPRWTYKLNRRADDDIPFDLAEVSVSLTGATRSGPGLIELGPLRHRSERLVFDVDFDPPLRVDEECRLEFTVDVPAHKAATVERAVARPLPRFPPPGGGEFISCDVTYRMEEFNLIVDIPRRLGSRAHGVEALAFGSMDLEEQANIATMNAFSSELIEEGGEEVYRLSLRRHRPPRKRTYRVYWVPPSTTGIAQDGGVVTRDGGE